jgi:hypothetical protein
MTSLFRQHSSVIMFDCLLLPCYGTVLFVSPNAVAVSTNVAASPASGSSTTLTIQGRLLPVSTQLMYFSAGTASLVGHSVLCTACQPYSMSTEGWCGSSHTSCSAWGALCVDTHIAVLCC